ncbi:MAG: cytochrome c3 family protein [Acidobacteriota bacterium]
MRKTKSSLFIILLFTIIFLNLSCSVEKNRKILSLFFDGVPESNERAVNSVIKVKRSGENTGKVVEIVSIHPDYKTKSCSKCHNRSASNFLKTDRKEICFSCHKKDKFTDKYIHGPVAVKACNTCHAPHRSVNRKLLLEDGRELCDLCHKAPLTGLKIPCKGDNCLGCHDPHVSGNKFFLLKGWQNNGSENERGTEH